MRKVERVMEDEIITELKEIEEEEAHLYLLGRPVPPVFGFSPTELEEHCNKIISFLKDGGTGLLGLRYYEGQGELAALLLLLLYARLKKANKKVRLVNSLTAPFIDTDYPYILIDNALRFSNFIEFLESNSKGHIIIATGLVTEWEKVTIPIPHYFYTIDKPIKEPCKIKVEVRDEIRDLYFLVCIFDAFGVPLPLSLLTKALNKDEDTTANLVDDARGFLYWIERESPPAILVSTKGEIVAWKMLKEGLKEGDTISGYRRVINSIDPKDKKERYTVIKLFHAFIQKSCKQLAKKIYPEVGAHIDRIWREGTSVELLAWGKIFECLYMYPESQEVFKEGIKRDPKNIFLLHAYGYMLGRWQKYDEARRIFRNGLKIEPKNIYLWQSWADMEGEKGEYEEARKLYSMAKGIDDKNIFVLVSFADLEARYGSYRMANALLNEAIRLSNGKSVYAYNVLGTMEARRGEYEKSLEAFKNALEIDPENIPTLNAMGMMYKERGHFEKALELFEEVLKIDPENLHTLNAIGELLGDKRRFEEAERYFKKILEIDPYNIKTLVSTGVMQNKKGNPDKAEALLREVLTLHPDNPYILSSLAEIYIEAGEFDEAEKWLKEALSRDRNNIPTLNSFGRLMTRMERVDDAREKFKRALKIWKYSEGKKEFIECIITYNTWANVEAKMGNIERAKELFEESLKLDPENAYTHHAYGSMLKEEGEDIEKAEMHLRKAEELGMRI